MLARKRLQWVLVIVLPLLLVGWFVLPERRAPLINPNPTGEVIVALGDSLTEGSQDRTTKGYPEHLSRLIGKPVINAGRWGAATADALKLLDEDVLRHNPRIVIVLLGGNDIIRRIPPEDTEANLREIIRRIQERGALVMLASVDTAIMGRSDAWNRSIARVAREAGVVYIPDVMRGILYNPARTYDKIHPNEEGERLLAERIYEGGKGHW